MEGSEEWITAAIPGTDGTVDIVAETQTLLAEQGLETERRGHDLHFDALGLTLSPRGISIRNTEGAQIRTISIVRVMHPRVIPAGLLEYQHGAGADLREALRYGLGQWAQLDVPVLCDALRCGTRRKTAPCCR